MRTTVTDKPDLETRVRQFSMLQLPGQPQGMHMGTSYLVNDLWAEVKRLELGKVYHLGGVLEDAHGF
jgi:hypothetical protein